MCESNKNNRGSDGKSSALAPLLSQVPKGASKIFILTPEILNNLGLAGHLDVRKACQDEPKSLNISTLNPQQLPGIANHESNTPSVKPIPEATSSTSSVKKRKRDSISERKTDVISETPKSSNEKSTELERKLNRINLGVSNDATNNKKEQICCTPKTKKIRRRSNTEENRKEEMTNKQIEKKSKDESEPVVSGVRSSKRPAKPKKFDDYVMTDIFSNKSWTNDNIDDTPVSAKRKSRKSSANSSNAESRNCSEKTTTEEVDKVKEMKTNKTGKAISRRSSMTRNTLSNDEICSDVPGTKFSVDKSKLVKTYERRNSQDQKTMRLMPNDKTISKNDAEPAKQESSGTITSHVGRKIFLPIQQSKINDSNIKIVKTYQKPKIKDRISSERVQLEDKSESKREFESATSIQEISENETISSPRKIGVNVSEEKIDVKAVKSDEKSNAKEDIGGEIVEPHKIKKSVEKTKPVSSDNRERLPKREIVSSTKIRTIETLYSKYFEKPCEMESQTDSSKSPEKKEEFKTPERKLTIPPLKGRIITISKSKLTKFVGPLNVSTPLLSILREKDDPSLAKSHLPRSPDKKEEASFSKMILPTIEDKKEIGALKTDLIMSSKDKKEEVNISEAISLKVPTEKQAAGSKLIMSTSRDDNEESNNAKTISSRCFTKENTLKPDATTSVDEKTATSSKSEKPKFSIKKRISIAKPNVSKLKNKKFVSTIKPEVSLSVDKNEMKVLEVSICQSSTSFSKKGTEASLTEVSTFPDKEESNASMLELPISSDVQKTLLPEVPTTADKIDAKMPVSEVPVPSVKEEIATSIPEVLISPAIKDFRTSIPEVPISFVEKKAMSSIPEVVTYPVNETNPPILETQRSPPIKAQDDIPNLHVNDAINSTDILNIDSSIEIPSTSSTSTNVKEEIVQTNFSITGDYIIAKKLEIKNKTHLEEVQEEVSKDRVPRKQGKRRSIKPQISIEVPKDQETNLKVENVFPTAASSFDILVESTCRMKKLKDNTDAKNLKKTEPVKQEILFRAQDKEEKDSIPTMFDSVDNPSDIVDSASSTEIQSMSSLNLVIEEEIVPENFPREEKSAIEAMKVKNCIPVQDVPKEVAQIQVRRKRGRPKKPRILIEPPKDQETNQKVANVISTAVNSIDNFVKKTCRIKKSTIKCNDDTEMKDLNTAEPEKHEILLRSQDEDGKDIISRVFDHANDSPDIVHNDSSTIIQPGSRTNLVVKEKIVPENFSSEGKSVIEAMKVENDIPVQDIPKEISEIRIPRKKGRPKKQPILIEPSENNETDQHVEKAISTAVNSCETVIESTCRKKKPVQRSMDEIDGKGLSEDSEGEFENDEIVLKRSRGRPSGLELQSTRGKRGRGRGRGKTRPRIDFEYVPRVKSSDKNQPNGSESKEVDNSEEPDVNDSQSTNVECGKCKEIMKKNAWSNHNLSKHNDMGWRKGEEAPDYSDERFLRSVLMGALKKKKKKSGLICETCGVGKRSANGFISHLQFCGKTEEERQSLLVTCQICGNVMMPSSMEMHQRFHRQTDAAVQEQKTDESTSTGREKRKAAKKAATKISEFTELVKDEVAPSKKRRREELMKLIEKPRYLKGTPNRWRGIWKSELNTKGAAYCRQPGCKFAGDSVEALCNHNIICPCTPLQNFVCKICKFSSESEKRVIKHVKAKHDDITAGQREDSDFKGEDSTSSSDSDSDHSDDKPQKSSVNAQKPVHEKRQRPKTNVKFLDDLSHIDPKWHTSYSPAIQWTMEFEYENYRLRLFDDLKPNIMKLLNDKDALAYLPELSSSIRTKEAKKRTNDKPPEWVTWKRFEGRKAEGIPAFFAGGPIWALAWLPIPAPLYNHSVDQYVAVSTHPTMESVYVVGKSHVGKNLIQIWNLGHLEHNKTTNHVAPSLSYGIAHDKGTIWCLEWCPSGCYEHSSFMNEKETAEENQDRKRMGLLAAACSDGCVHVFSLPFPDGLHLKKSDQSTNDSLPIYETKPILTLIVSTAMYEKGEQNWQCVKLNWSKELGHDTIIAGFSNGYVALWDLNSESPLFVTRRGETTLIDAFHHFYAHGHAVSFVQMVPYGGKRFFITSGYDRLTKVWDLEDISYPLSTTKRGIALDGAWLNHWPGYLTTYDDVMVHGHTYMMLLRQTGNKIFPLLPTNSPTYTVAVSDYGNSIGHGTLGGEVLVMFPHHLWNLRDMDRDVPRKRWLASSSEIVDIAATGSGKEKTINSCLKRKVGKDYVYMPDTYEDCKDRFGIIFRDNLTRSKRDGHRKKSRPPCSERLSAVQIEQYPFASVNRISWNPNAWSYLWLCVGYQNGLVRFLNFNSVAVNRELSRLLPSHAKSMLDKSRRSLKYENDPVNLDSVHPSDTRSNS